MAKLKFISFPILSEWQNISTSQPINWIKNVKVQIKTNGQIK